MAVASKTFHSVEWCATECLSVLGPWALPGVSFADLLCVQEKGSCHQLPEGPMRQKLPSSLWPGKGLPFTIFWRVQVSDEGGKLGCPFAICYLASNEIRVQFSRACFDSPENLSIHSIMRNSILTWQFHRGCFLLPIPSLNYKQLGFLAAQN